MEPIFIVLFVIIVILLTVETFYYKQLVDFAVGFSSLIDTYNAALTALNNETTRLGTDQLQIRQDLDLGDKEMTVIRLVLGIHSEALNVKQLNDLFKAVDALKNS